MKLIRSMIAVALAASALSGAVAEAAEFGPEIETATGMVRGVPRDPQGLLAFKGIPDAAPPVGISAGARRGPPSDGAVRATPRASAIAA